MVMVMMVVLLHVCLFVDAPSGQLLSLPYVAL